jgi:hypothetical protein
MEFPDAGAIVEQPVRLILALDVVQKYFDEQDGDGA